MRQLVVFDPTLGSDPSHSCRHPEWRRLLLALPVHSRPRPARLCLPGRHDSSGENKGISIGSAKGSVRSSGNPKSRSCRVRGASVAYGVPDAGPGGVNCLQVANQGKWVRVRRKKSKQAHTEYRSDEIGSFLGVFEKRSLEELRGCWPAQRVVSA